MFNTKNKTWTQIAKMNRRKCDASCVVFEGRIVVSGGYNNYVGDLNTVEAYDHIDDSWIKMPSLKIRRHSHKSVAIKNKLLVVGGFANSFVEVFDSCSNKFVLLKYNFTHLRHRFVSDITTLGNRILIFNNFNGSLLIYDVENK